MNAQYVFTVSEINRYIKEIIDGDLNLSDIWIKGEISNYKYHYSGHMYFTLKDEKSIIKCVMFRSQVFRLKFQPENGMKVIARGYISVFERDGQYQLYVEEMQPDGIGSLYLAFEQLKNKLEKEGLFDLRYKKKIPFLPRSIGVVTSSTGAVIRDIINILSRRFENFNLKLFPVPVQGVQAASSISKAIKKLNELKCVDVIILARGGGSLEELWPFNEEQVARSIFESEIPIISAVGHETDFTIADFVADLRAPTPSAAAELVIPEKRILKQRIIDLEFRLQNAVIKNINFNRVNLKRLKESIVFRQPYNRINQERMKLDSLLRNMTVILLSQKEQEKAKVKFLIEKLNALSPLNILARGYSIVKLKDTDKLVKSINDVKTGDNIEVTVNDGLIQASVIDSTIAINGEVVKDGRK
ncbi:MAG TPA: exodeoxyribonuclease VII large subunit [Clostridiaceae bacterium]|nr:exodeoxyribonuclease VII large subunit [Clostridiaceae bacterium]